MQEVTREPASRLSLGKILLFTVACMSIFIAVALICGALTSWIRSDALRIAFREVVLRAPLTIMALHLFATRIIRVYSPTEMYGKARLHSLLKWTVFAFVLPIAVWVSYYALNLVVPLHHAAPLGTERTVGLLVKWISLSIAAGLTEEVLFRGHLYMILAAGYSRATSIVITSLIFGLAHIVMLPAFSVSDVLTVVAGGFVAGLMFALIYHHSKVLWYAAVVHVVWDIFFIGKITAIAATQAEADQIILPFRLTTHDSLLTGGSFGVEAGLPCFVTYFVVIGYLYLTMRRGGSFLTAATA